MSRVQAAVKFGQHQVDLLKKVIKVLEPFYAATVQLSGDGACISEVILLTFASLSFICALPRLSRW